jgi:hypothetical protein
MIGFTTARVTSAQRPLLPASQVPSLVISWFQAAQSVMSAGVARTTMMPLGIGVTLVLTAIDLGLLLAPLMVELAKMVILCSRLEMALLSTFQSILMMICHPMARRMTKIFKSSGFPVAMVISEVAGTSSLERCP